MKTLRMFGMAIAAVLLCTNFAACSDDDDDDSSKVLENGNVMVSGHEAVDLGLSVKWATCNIGSYTPEGSGEYYAWGETEIKSDYSWDTYKWCEGTYKTITKYCIKDFYGVIDNRTELESSDDVATVKWGKKWRMPTEEEMEELVEYCTWTWITQNEVKGMKVRGPNGNSIFLPAAGYRDGMDFSYRGSEGSYWSATLSEGEDYNACVLYFYDVDGYRDWCGGSRCIGCPVRPVTE